MKVERWISWKTGLHCSIHRQTKCCHGRMNSASSYKPHHLHCYASSSLSLHSLFIYSPPRFHAPVLLWDSTTSSLSSLLPMLCFLNIPECNSHSRFSSLLASPDFLSCFPNMPGYLTPWHMDFSAFPVSRPSEHLSILLPNTPLAFDSFHSYLRHQSLLLSY